MVIILDADVIIRGEKGVFDLGGWVASLPDDRFGVAAITIAELWHGVERAVEPQKSKRRKYLETIVAALPIVPYPEQTAYEHARIWAELQSAGKMIADNSRGSTLRPRFLRLFGSGGSQRGRNCYLLPQSVKTREACVRVQDNLETAVEFLPRPRQPGLFLVDHWLRPKSARMAPFFAGVDRLTGEASHPWANATTLPSGTPRTQAPSLQPAMPGSREGLFRMDRVWSRCPQQKRKYWGLAPGSRFGNSSARPCEFHDDLAGRTNCPSD